LNPANSRDQLENERNMRGTDHVFKAVFETFESLVHCNTEILSNAVHLSTYTWCVLKQIKKKHHKQYLKGD